MAKEYVRQASYVSNECNNNPWIFQESNDLLDNKKQEANGVLSNLETDASAIHQIVKDESQNKDVTEDDILKSTNNCPDLKMRYDLVDSWEKLSNFEIYQKKNEQDIIEYISTFDEKYQQIAMKGITLPSEVLAFNLLCKSDLSRKEMISVIESMDDPITDDLYEQTKHALKTFQENQEEKKQCNDSVTNTSEPGNDISGRHYIILDSACSGTVCGKKWLDSYLDYLDEDTKKDVEYNPGKKTFIFGGGEPLKSIACCRIPAILAGKEITIVTDVVHSDIPLIYSLSDMKKSQVKLDFTNDTAEIYGKVIDLKMTPTGHYCVPIDGIETLKERASNIFHKNLYKMNKGTRSS